MTGAWQEARRYIPEIGSYGHDVVFMQREDGILPCDPAWVEGVVCNGLFLHHAMERFENLRFIQLTSAGYDRVDMAYICSHGVEIHTASGAYSIPMAEYAVAGVLQFYQQSRFFYENQKGHRWEKRRDLKELFGKTILIVGCGHVGEACAERFAAFGCRVIGLDRTVREAPAFERILPLSALDDLLPEADVVLLALGLSEQTRHLIDAGRLGRMKPGAVLVNLARGGLIDTEALTAALPRLGGALLDVFEEEPLPADSPLWDRDNVILTPHNSFVGDGNGERLAQTILTSLRRAARP